MLQVSARGMKSKEPIAIQTYPLGGGSKHRRAKAAKNLTPFPTLYWLTCPLISKAISNLERQGATKFLEERLFRDENDAMRKMKLCHEEYARVRWNSLLKEDKFLLLSSDEEIHPLSYGGDELNYDFVKNMDKLFPKKYKGFCNILINSGVAGTDWKRKDEGAPSIKCLHAHYAHFRSAKEGYGNGNGNKHYHQNINIIGEWTHQLLLNEGVDFL